MKKLVLILVLVGVAVGAWRWRSAGEPAAQSSKLVANRLWIDHVPRNERDTVQVFVALSQESVGVFNASSAWRGAYEVFKYEQQGSELRLVYPQTGKRETVRARATRCDVKDMDYCLELEGASQGAKRYYSCDGWEIDGGVAAARQRIEAVLAKLEAGT